MHASRQLCAQIYSAHHQLQTLQNERRTRCYGLASALHVGSDHVLERRPLHVLDLNSSATTAPKIDISTLRRHILSETAQGVTGKVNTFKGYTVRTWSL